jgi:hypothetical protein
VNALRDIETADEIEVRLQSNEVLVHLPEDTPLATVPAGIHDSGFKSDDSVWLTAEGTWTPEGFLPSGWSKALSATRPSESKDGTWELLYELNDDVWTFKSASPVDQVPQIQDEDG